MAKNGSTISVEDMSRKIDMLVIMAKKIVARFEEHGYAEPEEMSAFDKLYTQVEEGLPKIIPEISVERGREMGRKIKLIKDSFDAVIRKLDPMDA